jgi:HK97 family phage prohead protease
MEQFTFEGKALSTIEVAEGDLLLEGFAVIFAGLDRTLENFAPGSFRRACKAFLAGSAPLVFHHKGSQVLGKVLEMSEVPGIGVKVKARVDGAIKDSPELAHIYHQIRKGTLTGLSMGGFFKRAGNMIVDIDATELSVTGTPTHSAPSFAVVEGKSLEYALVRSELQDLEWLRGRLQAREHQRRDDLDGLRIACARIFLGLRST